MRSLSLRAPCHSWSAFEERKTKGVRTFGSTAAEIVRRGATLKSLKYTTSFGLRCSITRCVCRATSPSHPAVIYLLVFIRFALLRARLPSHPAAAGAARPNVRPAPALDLSYLSILLVLFVCLFVCLFVYEFSTKLP